MEIILKSGQAQYMAKPLDSHCWRLYKKPTSDTGRNGKPIKADWIPLDKYPWNLERAIKAMAEYIIRDTEGTIEIECGDCKACQLEKKLDEMIRRMSC